MSVLGTAQRAKEVVGTAHKVVGTADTAVGAVVGLASRTWFLIIAWILALSFALVEPAGLLGAALLTLYLYG